MGEQVILAATSFRQEGVATMTYHQLTQEERYRISAGHALRLGIRELARQLDRSPSTISRELGRNATAHDSRYRAEKAHSYAIARRRRARRGSHFTHAVMREVERALKQRLSPEQIVGHFRKEGLVVPSHETIYRRIRRDKQRGGRLYRWTRIMSKVGRKRYRSRPARGVLLGKRHITERPAAVDARSRIGDWEGDTVMGHGTSHCLLTLVERKSGYVIIRKLRSRSKAEATAAIQRAVRKHRRAFKTITFDNGTEFHDYKLLEIRSSLRCYFATPYHSWERGSNENLNGLVRQYLPKRTCLKNVTQDRCDQIARALNTRPRKRHKFKTPLQIYTRS
jgi:IS30 family transposase